MEQQVLALRKGEVEIYLLTCLRKRLIEPIWQQQQLQLIDTEAHHPLLPIWGRKLQACRLVQTLDAMSIVLEQEGSLSEVANSR